MERRKVSKSRPSELPLDYLKMVKEIFTSHFDAGLKIYHEIHPQPYFEASGEIFADEIVVAISLTAKDQLAAATVYASVDFDLKASLPAIQELLGACVDAAGSVFSTLLPPENPEVIARLAEEPLSALENVPFDWTSIQSNQRQIFVKVDKSNLGLDAIADQWLKEHDPELQDLEEKEQKETEKLFFTGDEQKKRSKSPFGT